MWKSISVAAPLILALLASCKSDSPTSGPGANAAVMSGQVTQSGNGPAIAGATVAATLQGTTFSGNTDATGNYTVTVSLLDTLPATVSVTVSASGYQTVTQNVVLQPNQTTDADFQLSLNTTPVPPPPPGGGYANTLAYVGVTTVSLAVYGVGGAESAVITFEARDSLGSPILPIRADTVTFFISGGPVTGGAYITPTSALTNTAARVSTVVQSGVVAGAIQLVASLTRDTDGMVVRSTPVKVLIHGGLPDQTHFGIGANPFNVPGYYKIGASSSITALVGDRYGNPVAPGTAVYFGNPGQGLITTTTGYTTPDGFATVTLYTGVNHAANGLGSIYAETVGENSVAIRDSLTVLFSGNSLIANLNGPLVVDSVNQAVVTFNVWDERQNPLAAGTTITATVDGASAIVSKPAPTGALSDVISTFWTNFSVVVSRNNSAEPLVTGPFTLTISVTGPNGAAERTLTGTVN
jgi:hypothetical protein